VSQVNSILPVAIARLLRVMGDRKPSATVLEASVQGSAHTGLRVCGQHSPHELPASSRDVGEPGTGAEVILQPGKPQRLEVWIL